MSIKKRLLNYLKSVEEFLDDGESQEAIDFLKNKVQATEINLSDAPKFKDLPELGPKDLAIYSDGACRGNPGPGSWAYMIQNNQGEVLGYEANVSNPTTNNKMELTGAIRGLEALAGTSVETVYLFTDSKYIVDGITKWVPGWKARGWKKADKKAPENLELWQQLDSLNAKYEIDFNWVKGHSGHPQNEFVDQLANEVLDDQGY
jgi:ribonuclease HI